jgi:hypothetical protein
MRTPAGIFSPAASLRTMSGVRDANASISVGTASTDAIAARKMA